MVLSSILNILLLTFFFFILLTNGQIHKGVSPTVNWKKIVPRNVEVPGTGSLFGIVPRIVGGRDATRGQFPWQAGLLLDQQGICGGSLISSTVVLTAAHCTFGVRRITVYLGAHNIKEQFEATRIVMTTTKSSAYPKYDNNDRKVDYDIGLVTLPETVKMTNYISTIRLPIPVQTPSTYEGYRARVSGWGIIADGSKEVSDTLKYADVTVMKNSECKKVYGRAINDAKLCVSTKGGNAPCSGDSGGPLVIQDTDRNFTLIGIVSFGSARGCSNGQPSVFTRVTSYLKDPYLTSVLPQSKRIG